MTKEGSITANSNGAGPIATRATKVAKASLLAARAMLVMSAFTAERRDIGSGVAENTRQISLQAPFASLP